MARATSRKVRIMSEIKVERGVKMPTINRNKKSKYPWGDMKPGDSFLVPAENRKTVASLATTAGKRYKMKFATRQVEDGALRVWRVS